MDALRPLRFVELGTHHGYSYFAFCQAVQRLGSGTSAYAVDTWTGDDHAGLYGDEVFRAVQNHNRARYSSFSTLLRCTFEAALSYFEDESVNLLHIDGQHYYDDVKKDFLQWAPKLAPNAIVLLHDTNVRERGFGVWRLFGELARQHPSFNFEHGNGLGVLAPGDIVPEALQPLFAANTETATKIKSVYAALGGALSTRRALQAKTEAIASMLRYGPALSLEHAQPLGEMADGDTQVQEVLGALLRVAASAEEQRQLVVARGRDIEALQAQIDQLVVARAHDIEALQAQIGETREERDLSMRELAGVIRDLNRTRAAAAEKDTLIAELRGKVGQQDFYIQAVEQRLGAIKARTSYKTMKRVRKALKRVPRGAEIAVQRTARLVSWTATGQVRSRLRERRRPRPLAAPELVDLQQPQVLADGSPSAIPESARAVDLDFSLKLPLRHVAVPQRADGPVAAIIHMYYPELAVEFRSYLQNIPGPVNIFISATGGFDREMIEKAFSGWSKGSVKVRVVPNRGRDISPKLVSFRDVYDSHSYVLHLHTKKSDHASVLANWRHFLLENLLGDEATVSSIFAMFEHNPRLGIIASQHFEPVRHWINWGHNFDIAVRLAARMGLNIDYDGVLDFPSGSMFWARSAALRPLLDLALSTEDFEEEAGQTDRTLAHAIERLYFFACERAGFDWTKVARPEFFAHTPSIIAVRDGRELDLFFARHVFRLLDQGEVRPRTAPLPGPTTVAPALLDSARDHALGCRRDIAAGTRMAIGVVTYNNEEAELRLAIGAARLALGRVGLPTARAIWVLDNGAPTDTGIPPEEAVVRLPSRGNVGFGAGHNLLMTEAFAEGADIYVAINPDGAMHPDAAGALVRMIQAHAGRALVEALQFPMEHPKPYDPLTLETPWVSGACLAIPRQAFDELGGFDEVFFMYCEDVDLSWRARASGFALKTCPQALFLHAVTNRDMDRHTLGMIYGSGIVLARRWGAPTFESWLEAEMAALKLPLPGVAGMPVPVEWRRYADFEHHFSFAKPRW